MGLPQPLKPDVFEILLALSAAPLHGYAILKVLEGRGVRLPASLLYRKLRRLMDDGLVKEWTGRSPDARTDSRRRYYRLTPAGQAVTRAEAERIVELAQSGHVRALAQRARGGHA